MNNGTAAVKEAVAGGATPAPVNEFQQVDTARIRNYFTESAKGERFPIEETQAVEAQMMELLDLVDGSTLLQDVEAARREQAEAILPSQY